MRQRFRSRTCTCTLPHTRDCFWTRRSPGSLQQSKVINVHWTLNIVKASSSVTHDFLWLTHVLEWVLSSVLVLPGCRLGLVCEFAWKCYMSGKPVPWGWYNIKIWKCGKGMAFPETVRSLSRRGVSVWLGVCLAPRYYTSFMWEMRRIRVDLTFQLCGAQRGNPRLASAVSKETDSHFSHVNAKIIGRFTFASVYCLQSRPMWTFVLILI